MPAGAQGSDCIPGWAGVLPTEASERPVSSLVQRSDERFLLSLLPRLGNSVQGQESSAGNIKSRATSRAGERRSAQVLAGGGLPKVGSST